MSRVLRRLRNARSERGMTLVELMVTMSLLSLVLVIFVSIMASVQKSVEREIDRSNDNDQARLAIQALDKEIRSGNILYNPNTTAYLPPGTSAGMGMTVYTQALADIRDPGNRCVQWRLSSQKLQRRDWQTGNPSGTVTPWRVVAENVVNTTAQPVFALDTDTNKGSRIVNITIRVQTAAGSGRVVVVSASLTGRNTSYGYPLEVCSVIPSA